MWQNDSVPAAFRLPSLREVRQGQMASLPGFWKLEFCLLA